MADEPIQVGRSGQVAVRLADPTVSRRHATLTRPVEGGAIALEDHDGRFGTYVNGARVRAVALTPGDRVRFGSHATYRVEPAGLRLEDLPGGMALEVEGLGISAVAEAQADARRWPPWRSGNPDSDGDLRRFDLLVEDLRIRARPDSFVGILGPSGSGKSTLLGCLAGRRPPARGRVLYDDGRDAYEEPEAYRERLGLVPQDDVIYPRLTGRENLRYAARLRLGDGPELDATIAGVLGRVGLGEHADKPVAVLSGGQRKRLSVAIELLRRPRLLLLDEPTSGLDPASEAHLMEQLRHLARGGTTVVCTTHLMDNLGLFDEVVVLGVAGGVGRLAYAGPPGGLLAHFGSRGFADLYESLASGRFEPVPLGRPATQGLALGLGAIANPDESDRLEPAEAVLGPPRPRGGGRIDRPRPGPATGPGAGQFLVVSARAARILTRDRWLVAALVAQPVVLGALALVSQYDAGGPFPILFFAVVIATWLGLNNAARDLVRERRQYARDRLAGLRPVAYLGAKAAVHAAMGLAQVAILLLVLRVGCGMILPEPASGDLAGVSLARWSSVLMLSCLGGVGLGLLASTLARTEEAAVAVLPLLIMPQLLLSAVAAGVHGMPYTEGRPFRPLVVSILKARDLNKTAAFVDLISMACPSRAAALAAEAPPVRGFSRWIWVGDLSHLLILVLGTWSLLFLAFRSEERRWLSPGGI